MFLMTTGASAEPPSTNYRINQALMKAGEAQSLVPGAQLTRDGVASVEATRPAGTVTADGSSVRLSLQDAPAAKITKPAPNGAGKSFGNVDKATDALVRPLDGGVQILSVMNDASAPTTQRYEVDLPAGTHLEAAGDGFTIVGSDKEIHGEIAPPWAKDATGRNLPTSYALSGTTLIQTTDTADATFPVVADPRLTYGRRGVYLNFWGHELRIYAAALTAVLGSGIVVACTLIGNLPYPAARSLATMVCGAIAINLRTVFEAVVALSRSRPTDSVCYQKWLNSSTSTWVTVDGRRNCSG